MPTNQNFKIINNTGNFIKYICKKIIFIAAFQIIYFIIIGSLDKENKTKARG